MLSTYTSIIKQTWMEMIYICIYQLIDQCQFKRMINRRSGYLPYRIVWSCAILVVLNSSVVTSERFRFPDTSVFKDLDSALMIHYSNIYYLFIYHDRLSIIAGI